MLAKIIITFEITEMYNIKEAQQYIERSIKPMLDTYHTGAKIIIIPGEITFNVEGTWNG